jgi:hypothetical protein
LRRLRTSAPQHVPTCCFRHDLASSHARQLFCPINPLPAKKPICFQLFLFFLGTPAKPASSHLLLHVRHQPEQLAPEVLFAAKAAALEDEEVLP